MADNNAEIIGGVAVTVEADLSDLQSSFDQAVATATRAGEDISSALTAASDTTSTDALTQSIQSVGNAAETAGSQMAALADEPQTLAQYYDELEAAALGASSSTEQLGSTVAEASSNFTEGASAASNLSEHVSEAGHAAHEAEGGFKSFAESLTALAEAFVITEGLKEFATEALSVYGAVQKATISLTALTGSAGQATATIERLKELATSEALSFPKLVAADQRMTAFGISTEKIPALLQDAANAAAATGNDFERTSQALIRMTASGMASGRMLVSLGITTTDLGNAMGVTSQEVAKAFKALDQSERVEKLDAALQKFNGVASAVAQSIPGQWQNVKTQFEFVMEGIGEAIAPTASAIMSFLTDTVIPAVKGIIDAFNELPDPIKTGVVVIGGLTAALVPLSLGLAGIVAGIGAVVAAWPLFLTVAAPVAPILLGIGTAATMAATAVYEAKLSLEAVIGATVSWKDTLLMMVGLESEATIETKALAAQQSQLAEDVKKATDKLTEQGNKLRQHMVDLGGVASASAIARDLASAHTLKVEGLSSALEGAQQHLHKVQQEFYAGLATEADVTKAFDEVTEATHKLKEAHAQLSPEAKRLADYLKLVSERTAQWRIDVLALPAPIATVSSATEVAAAETKAHAEAISYSVSKLLELKTALVQAQAAYEVHRGSLEAVLKAEERVAAEQAFLNKLVGEAPKFDAVAAALMASELGKVGAGIASVVQKLPALQPFTQTLEQIDLEWAKNSGSINRLAKYDLPAAIQAYTDYIRKLEGVAAPIGQIYDAEEKLLQLEINAASQRGEDATSQIVQLTNLKEKTEALQFASQGLGDVYAGLVHSFDDAFLEMGRQLSDVAVGVESLGQAMHNFAQKIASEVVNVLVKYALGELKKAIVGVMSDLSSVSGGIGTLAGKLAGTITRGAGTGAAGVQMQTAVTQFNAAVAHFQAITGQLQGVSTQFSATVGRFAVNVGQFGAGSTTFDEATTFFDETTGIFDESVATFDAASSFFDESTTFFDESAAFFDESTVGFDASTVAFGTAVAAFSVAVSTMGAGGLGGLLSIFAMKGGGEVGDVPILSYLHPKEMVLPADLTAGIKNIIASGSTNMSSGLGNATVNINSGTLPNLSGFTDAVNGFTDAIASSAHSDTQASPTPSAPSVSVSVPQAPSPRIAVPLIQAPEASSPKSPAPRTEPEPSISSVTASAFRTSVGDFAEIAGSLGKLPVAVTNFKTTTDSFTDRLGDFGSKMSKSGATSTAESGTSFSSPGLSGAVGLRLYAFEGGGDVPGNVLALLHAQEMVLPAPLAQGLRNLFAQGGIGQSPKQNAPQDTAEPTQAKATQSAPQTADAPKTPDNPFVDFGNIMGSGINALIGSLTGHAPKNAVPDVTVSVPSGSLSLPSVPSSASSFALPSTSESSVSGNSEHAVFENCVFNGVTQTMVNDLMNKVVQATRRAGSRF